MYLYFPVSILNLEYESKKRGLPSLERESVVGVQGLSFIQNLSGLKEVRCLDYLVQAHTLLAVMADRTSPEHQLNLLRAYTFVLQIWQVLQLYWNLVHHSTLPKLMRLFPTQIILELKIRCALVRHFTAGCHGSCL